MGGDTESVTQMQNLGTVGGDTESVTQMRNLGVVASFTSRHLPRVNIIPQFL